MARRFNWLSAYAEYVSESESPDSWHFWVGLSVLSSAVRRNVWVNQGHFVIFPNQYIVLVGPPGLGKSTSIRLGRRLLYRVEELQFGPDSVTREELISIMSRVGNKDKQSALTLHSTELSSLIEPSGVHMIQFLIDIYDSDDMWKYGTKGSGKYDIHFPFLNILAGTFPDYLTDDFPVPIVGNGFTARTIFVYEEKARFPNAFPKAAPKHLVDALVDELLGIIENCKGEFTYAPGAREVYETYYNKVFNSTPSDHRIVDFHSRKAKVHLMKVAMMLSVAERDELVLHPTDFHTAWELLEVLSKNLVKTFSAAGKYEYASDFERIVGDIYAAGEMSVTELYNRNRSVGDAETIGKILLLGERSGQIIQFKKLEGGEKIIYYKPGA